MTTDKLSELLAYLQHKAAIDEDSQSSWGGYATLLRYADAILQRAPLPETLTTYTEDDIDHLFEAELEYLAQALVAIFPVRGPEELIYYVDTSHATSALQDR